MKIMKKHMLKLFVLLAMISVACTTTLFAEENPGFAKRMWRKFINRNNQTQEVKKTPVSKEPVKELSNEEMIERMKNMIEVYPEIKESVPGLKIAYGKEDAVEGVELVVDGESKQLSELDDDTLKKLYSRIANERTRLYAERIQKQLETVRRAQGALKLPPQSSQPPRLPQLPPAPPKVFSPPPRPPQSSRK